MPNRENEKSKDTILNIDPAFSDDWSETLIQHQSWNDQNESQIFISSCQFVTNESSTGLRNFCRNISNSSDIASDEDDNYFCLILLVFPLLTVFGNVLVVLSVYRERNLKTVTNYFIVSLAVADIMVATFVMPLSIYVEVKNGQWFLGDALCDAWVAFDVMCCTASILNLTAISLDRFMAVTLPIQYAKHKTSNRVYITVLTAWTLSVAVSLPIVLGINYTERRAETPQLCIFYNSDFLILSSMASFYIPCIVMVLLYWRIFRVISLRASRSRTARAMASGSVEMFSRSSDPAQENKMYTELEEPKCQRYGMSKNTPGISKSNENKENKSKVARGALSTRFLLPPERNHRGNGTKDLSPNKISDENRFNFQNQQTIPLINSSSKSNRTAVNRTDNEGFWKKFKRLYLCHIWHALSTKYARYKHRVHSAQNTRYEAIGYRLATLSREKSDRWEHSSTQGRRAASRAGSTLPGPVDRSKCVRIVPPSIHLPSSSGRSSMNKNNREPDSRADSRAGHLWSNGTGKTRAMLRFNLMDIRKRVNYKARDRGSQSRERKATKTLAIVLGVFLFCWVPFFTINIINAVCIRYSLFSHAICQPDPILFSFFVWLGYLNSLLNPAIYTIFNAEFRRAFKKLLYCPV